MSDTLMSRVRIEDIVGKPVEKKTEKVVIPFGPRVVVQKLKVGEKIEGSCLFRSEAAADVEMDAAKILYISDCKDIDTKFVKVQEELRDVFLRKALSGDPASMQAYISCCNHAKEVHALSSLYVGQYVMIGKYVGTSFLRGKLSDLLWVLWASDVMGRYVEVEVPDSVGAE